MTSSTGPRVAMLSVHTSPLDQPGTGDAGGMNVYVTELAQALARRGAQVEIFTRATSSAQPREVELAPGVLVRHVPAGPFEGLDKNDLPGQLCAFAAGALRTEASRAPGWYDVVHSHYWLSGEVGWLVADRWDVPLVHTMHTMARVKNAALAPGDRPEPQGRVIGEEQVVAEADALVASTQAEAEDLVALYHADPSTVHVVAPGVDLGTFAPAPEGTRRADLRAALGVSDAEAGLVVFAGRVQPLKGPDVLVRALGVMRAAGQPVPTLVVLGGSSGRRSAVRELEALAHTEGVAEHVVVRPPADRAGLADWFRAADLVAVPSHNESFGLVAAEAQACGTPVVAAAVGGLRHVVADGASGVLVPDHDPVTWAAELGALLDDDVRRARLAAGARAASERFSWDDAAEQVLKVYDLAREERTRRRG
ncbi:D-inositol-3-phosphate glycosyltransferase [Sediminihabitans luteus]|uniref:D-inositol-3-phosphate glycosyltransferase n=1 Tax=Sediminihabitans luteus TaxID=1138585 RepID=A0A2M9CEC0_9CELL|nr:D-inositol-3-phosphate glycosyltransferase [Sediminihabitans luteus]PJJ70227.1 D-inositol-3-phosphate glycosyltransferase [Sediminihabitans luteus]GII97698.1 D-inositol-3-phosphate glycosyltransferase [Sediminihabitans luteus]